MEDKQDGNKAKPKVRLEENKENKDNLTAPTEDKKLKERFLTWKGLQERKQRDQGKKIQESRKEN